MTSELKPCPFCGGAPEFENTDERARLRCTGCGTESGLFFFSQDECDSGISDATEARAIAAWNVRSLASSMAAPQPNEKRYLWLRERLQSITYKNDAGNDVLVKVGGPESVDGQRAAVWDRIIDAAAAPAVPSDPKIEGMK